VRFYFAETVEAPVIPVSNGVIRVVSDSVLHLVSVSKVCAQPVKRESHEQGAK